MAGLEVESPRWCESRRKPSHRHNKLWLKRGPHHDDEEGVAELTYETVDHWINTIPVVLIVTGFVTLPLAVLIHELGHAWAHIRLGGRPTVILAGPYTPIFHHRFKRLDLHWHPIVLGGVCHCRHGDLTVADLRRILNAGPRATVGFGLVCALLAAVVADTGGLPLYIAGAGFLLSIYITLDGLIRHKDEFGDLTDGGKLRILAKVPADLQIPRSQPPPRPR
jgi:hypothetical protein